MERGPTTSAGLGNTVKYSHGNGKENKSIEVPRFGNTPVQQGVESPLTAAPRAIVSRKFMENAAHPSVSGIMAVIVPNYSA